MSDRAITTSEAARMLGMSAERVRQLANAGRLPCRQTALGRLFDPADVAAFAKLRRPASEGAARAANGLQGPGSSSH
jgi:excisionase family DNA binding protein